MGSGRGPFRMSLNSEFSKRIRPRSCGGWRGSWKMSTLMLVDYSLVLDTIWLLVWPLEHAKKAKFWSEPFGPHSPGPMTISRDLANFFKAYFQIKKRNAWSPSLGHRCSTVTDMEKAKEASCRVESRYKPVKVSFDSDFYIAIANELQTNAPKLDPSRLKRGTITVW